jgi:hypothetical protein
VSQISPPIRILIILAAAVLGVYMLFLRPKPEEITPLTTTTNPPASQPAEATKSKPTTSTEKAPAKANGASAEPAEDLKGLPKPLRQAIRQDKVVVLLFWNDRAADDRAVRASLKKVDRHDGRVFVHAAPLKQISKYGRIARGVNVEQSPTVVVADQNLKADTLVGFVDRQTIDQAVTDAMRNSSGQFTSSYLRQVDKVCVANGNAIAAVPNLRVESMGEADTRLARLDRRWAAFSADFKAIAPPKKWAAFHKASAADIAAVSTAVHRASVSVTPSSSATVAATAQSTNSSMRAAGTGAAVRFDAQGLYRCGSQF